MKINKTIIKDGIILFASTYVGAKAFKSGCREFERAVPKAIDKIVLGRAMAETLVSPDDEDEE